MPSMIEAWLSASGGMAALPRDGLEETEGQSSCRGSVPVPRKWPRSPLVLVLSTADEPTKQSPNPLVHGAFAALMSSAGEPEAVVRAERGPTPGDLTLAAWSDTMMRSSPAGIPNGVEFSA